MHRRRKGQSERSDTETIPISEDCEEAQVVDEFVVGVRNSGNIQNIEAVLNRTGRQKFACRAIV